MASRHEWRRRTSIIGVVAALLSPMIIGALGGSADAVNFAHAAVVSADPANFTPNILDGRVNAIVQIGARLIAGGDFSQVQAASGGAILTRTDLVAFDAATGVIDTAFKPSSNGAVEALAATPDGNVFVSGTFTSMNGSAFGRLVKLNPADGQIVQTFHPQPSGHVRTITVRGGILYAGGAFTVIGGASRSNLAALDATTGAAISSFNLPVTDARKAGTGPSVYKLDVSPDGTKMMVIGNFTKIAGLTRWQAGMIDLGTTPASVRNWQTDRYRPDCLISWFDTYMRDVDFSPDGSYFVIVSTGGHFTGALCDVAAKWDANAVGSALQPMWVDDTGSDTLSSVAVTGTAVYVGGHQRWLNNPFGKDFAGPGAVPRAGVGALDPVNGLPFSWNPGKDRGVGVFDMYTTSAGLWIGSDTDHVAGEVHEKIAFFPLVGGTTIAPTTPYSLPGDLYNAPMTGAGQFLTRRTFDGVALGTRSNVNTPGVDWSTVRGIFALHGILYYGSSNGTVSTRTFDGSLVGSAQSLDLHGITNFPVASLSGMAFTSGRIYYTVQGDPRMYYRYFTPESRMLGAESWIASGNGDGFDWSTTRGLTLAAGKLYLARTNGNLYSVSFANGVPVPGSESLISSASSGYNWASNGMFVFSQSTQETTPPTTPGKPAGQSSAPGSITISWSTSQDASPPITYRIYRDGTQVGSTTTLTFTDTGLGAGTTHTYAVTAVDRFNNVSQFSPTSDPITVQSGTGPIFSDSFVTGDFSNWSGVTRLTIDTGTGSGAPPSALAQVTAQSAFAFKNLSNTFATICMSVNVQATSLGSGSPDLFRLRTASDGPIARVYVATDGTLYVRADATSTKIASGVALGTGWHRVELCGTVGTSGTWDLYRDGAKIVNAWMANTGTTPVGRIQIGDDAAKTFTINFDDVVVDQVAG
jgi:hypothetical protein